MRVVLDTNVLISALISPSGAADRVYRSWRAGVFDLVSCEEQIAEIRRVTRRPVLRGLIRPAEAGRLVNQLRHLAMMADPLPEVTASPDPWDNFMLAAALGGRANFLVTGDKSGLLALTHFGRARIVTIRQFLQEVGYPMPLIFARSSRRSCGDALLTYTLTRRGRTWSDHPRVSMGNVWS